jgi:uncharacterized Zn-binding protein involved in type VI secretion
MSFPAARLTDMTMHGGLVTAPGLPLVLIGGMPAARMGDIHTCPMVTVAVPHATGPIVLGAFNVLVGGMPQARMMDMCVCVGPPSMVTLGAFTTLVGMAGAFGGGLGGALGAMIGMVLASSGSGTPAKADAAPVSAGKGGSPKKDTVEEAIVKIEKSKFGKTDEGKKVTKKLRELQKDGKIEFQKLPDKTRGNWGDGKIGVNDKYAGDVDATASELVHEGSHAVNEDELPASKTKATIDEEMRTNKNQVDFYKEQKADGFRDPALDRRLKADEDGKLRDDVKRRYPALPEHL